MLFLFSYRLSHFNTFQNVYTKSIKFSLIPINFEFGRHLEFKMRRGLESTWMAY
jgi:hypothetical protein